MSNEIKMMPPPDTVYSTDGEDFLHTELEDAIDDSLDSQDVEEGEVITIWSGETSKHRVSDWVPDMMDAIDNAAYDECGEWADGWPSATDEQRQELQTATKKLADEWADKYGQQPGFFTVEDPEEMRIRIYWEKKMTGGYKYEIIPAMPGKGKV